MCEIRKKINIRCKEQVSQKVENVCSTVRISEFTKCCIDCFQYVIPFTSYLLIEWCKANVNKTLPILINLISFLSLSTSLIYPSPSNVVPNLLLVSCPLSPFDNINSRARTDLIVDILLQRSQ